MIKVISALAVAAMIGGAMPAFAQETIGSNGHEVDGHGGGGSQANRLHPDGPGGGAFVTRSSDGTCYLHSGNNVIIVRCPPMHN
ncbi:MAG: hypothetical protein ABI398_11585 [Devosia sp.]